MLMRVLVVFCTSNATDCLKFLYVHIIECYEFSMLSINKCSSLNEKFELIEGIKNYKSSVKQISALRAWKNSSV